MSSSARLVFSEEIKIPFSKPTNLGNAFCYPQEHQTSGSTPALDNNLHYARNRLLEVTGADHLHLVHSCTAALEIAIMAIDLGPGDGDHAIFRLLLNCKRRCLGEALPLFFVDISCEDLNVNPDCIAEAITTRTKAVLVVHYAGCASRPVINKRNYKSQWLNFD